ncbi:sulfide/dihydroorotate dehydrogenase-like FAD/NAD-binding protein [Candidatus Fermentibacteria bacterium]|nr:sulfide/dihydroorotate dehydrogenase-like FAD/NAD-binding protein [Candidatus Fermentibacteria bacterium]
MVRIQSSMRAVDPNSILDGGQPMHRILSKERLGPEINRYVIEAPQISRRRKPGQFVIIRLCPEGERIPLTIADADPEEGTLTLVVQAVGKTTWQLADMEEGDEIIDVTGPLGRPTHIERYGTVLCVGGGIGVAPLYPITSALKDAGNEIVCIIGARSADLLIMEKEMESVSDHMLVTTDDGSYGMHGMVTDGIKRIVVEEGRKADFAVAIGPPVMMKFTCLLTGELEIPTMVSLNPIMIDGTGMCGGCRVSVGGKTKFACVDGPEFDGHQVDFDELMKRLSAYRTHEKEAMDRYSECRAETGGGGR